MTKFFYSLLIMGAITSCSNNANNNAKSSDTTTKASTSENMSPEEEKGLNLVAKNDCLGCHKINEQLQGPAYMQVAQRYKDSPSYIVDTLADKIIRGGSGRWQTAVQMTPHPNLSKDDAQAMVKYILSLKQ